MTRRSASLILVPVLTAAALLTVGCSPGSGTTSSTPTASPKATLTNQQIAPLFMQCLIDHKITIWDRAQGNMNLAHYAALEGWYKNGRVTANHAFYVQMENFEGTVPISPDFKPEHPVGDWIDNASATGAWPKVCAPLPK